MRPTYICNSNDDIKYIKAEVEAIVDTPERLRVYIPQHRRDWIAKIKQVPHARLDKTLKYWTIPHSKEEIRIFHHLFKGECKYNIKLTANIPEYYKDYFEQKNPNAKVVIRADNHPEWFKVFMPKEAEAWRDIVKQIPGRRWNGYEKVWLLPYVKYSFRHLKRTLGSKLAIEMHINPNIPDHFNYSPASKKIAIKQQNTLLPKQQKALTSLEERLLMERKSWTTIKTYKAYLRGLFQYYSNTLPSQITGEQIKNYMLYKIKTDRISERTQGQIINAFAAFYKRLLQQEEKLELLKRPKKIKDMPNIFSKEEVTRLLKNIQNLKHKTLIMLVYSAGLRKSEIINLRTSDVLFDRKCIFVKCSKGKRDRYVMLSDKAAKFLKLYIGQYAPKYWLFEGQDGGRYGERSIQSIFMAAKIKAKVNPYVTFHGLRHSFATHLVDNNVPLHMVKDLLGHQSIKTTQVYLHISNNLRKNIQSPLDALDI